jgi:hypothetical protein
LIAHRVNAQVVCSSLRFVTKNAQYPRTLDCIYLRYVDNDQGGHDLLDLQTGRTIKRRTVTVIPITSNVIDLVHQMATNDGIQDGLKIKSKSSIILYDSSWIAGVDYNKEDNTQDDEEFDINEDDNDDENYDRMDLNDAAEILQEPIAEAEEQQNDENSINSNPTGDEDNEEQDK